MLEGVRQDRWRIGPDEARRLDEAVAARGQVAYRVVWQDDAFHANRARERRAGARESTRLRSAKALDPAFRFVCECRICDRSLDGLRLALARDVPLPRRLAVHIDESGEVRCGTIVWRRGPVIGVRLHEFASGMKPCDRFALRERYYGILD
ncbi:MAG TPA: hypothetical protein VFE63_11755 [Roseiarcus sp.]|jgi:hypothetical protein|nr:hypothetical protein [Roseiarcus sp.]